ncbi:competence protein CoiA [Ornithinibacillus contaminans]|uniref:competence protein CoiA n=1 Tax=Ornithinibacillus contaminans TaxID=694055 RepID=UPI00064DD14C|nr:competence protein CoiA family protein [Ornithinibacillus contaminans]
MLQAKLNTGKLVTLYGRTKSEIEWLRKHRQFYCPTCNSKVMIKAGTKSIPHFSHYSTADCPSSEGGEGEYHEKGKLALFQWLQNQGLQVSLEEYIPQIQQRPDIYLQYKEKKIAIEYQCARIPIHTIQQRTNGYIKVGIMPVWILGVNHLKRKSKNVIQVDQFIQQFIHVYPRKRLSVIYFFDPHTNHLIHATDLFPIKHSRVIANLTIKKLHTIPFLQLFNLTRANPLCMLEEWKKAKFKFRMHQPRRVYGKERAWYQWLYLKGTHWEKLPSSIYLPVSSPYLLDTEPWNWQSRICLEIIEPLAIGDSFSLNNCYNLLRKSITRQTFPLINSSNDPILEYLHLLSLLQILRPTTPNKFIKCKQLVFHATLEDALKGDELLMEYLCKNFQANHEHDS